MEHVMAAIGYVVVFLIFCVVGGIIGYKIVDARERQHAKTLIQNVLYINALHNGVEKRVEDDLVATEKDYDSIRLSSRLHTFETVYKSMYPNR